MPPQHPRGDPPRAGERRVVPVTVNRAFVAAVTKRLTAEADPARAVGQQRYMKSSLPYFGVAMPRTVAITREVVAEFPLNSYEDWHDTVLTLFREATHRELWYVATELAKRPAYRAYARSKDALDLWETIIVEGAWWDIVDDVAAHLVGGLFEADAPWTAAHMRRWATDEHLWKRRTAIICQIRRGTNLDLTLLHDCIEPNVGDADFFIRKAIGWALREASKTHPDEVVRYVHDHRDRLSALSKREALKRLLKSGTVNTVP